MNPITTSETASRQKRVRTDPSARTMTIDLTTPAPTPKTNQSPTKSATQALEGATASLPTSLHPLVLHFGNKLISIRAKRITKENIVAPKHASLRSPDLPDLTLLNGSCKDFVLLGKAPESMPSF